MLGKALALDFGGFVARAADATAGPAFAQLTATRAHLRQLFWARNVVIAAALGAVALHDTPLGGVIALAIVVNALAAWRLRQPAAVTYREFLLQVLADVALVTAAIQQTGGPGSALGELNYIPLAVAAATLPGAMVAAVFLIVTLLHELACHVVPGTFWLDPEARRLDLLVGGVVCVFVYCMARSSRRHEALVAAARERYSRDRQAAALDTLAASVAHQLASPLATMAVAVGELRATLGGRHPAALDVLETQVRACKAISSQVLATTGQGRAEGGARIAADRFLASIVEKYALMHPWTEVECRHEGPQPVPEILAEAALEEALLVLLLGLSGARRGIRVAHRWDGARLTLHICDGEPIRPDAHPDFILAKSTIGRFGGTISAVPEPDGRSCVEVSLPLDRLAINP